MKSNEIEEILSFYVPDPKCPLNYEKDYELLIATLLSAQCTDDRVNKVTKELFSKFDVFKLSNSKPEDIIDIIRPCGNMNKKSKYIIDICKSLVDNYNGVVPNDREYLESLPGVGRKTANVVLGNVFNEPTFAVDTHVERVSKRLGLAKEKDDVLTVENKLMKKFDKENWVKSHHQILLFGRFYCKSQNPLCDNCKFKSICKKK